MFFRLLCLPFGASAAFHSFIRISLSVCHLGHVLFLLPWSAFCDLSQTSLSKSLETNACSLLDLLGFATTKTVTRPIHSDRCSVRALGVEFDFFSNDHRSFMVRNTQERTQELRKDLHDFASSGGLSRTIINSNPKPLNPKPLNPNPRPTSLIN